MALCHSYSDPYVSAAPAPRRLSAYTNGSTDATTKAGGLHPAVPARAARRDLRAAAAPRRAAAPQAYAAGVVVEAGGNVRVVVGFGHVGPEQERVDLRERTRQGLPRACRVCPGVR